MKPKSNYDDLAVARWEKAFERKLTHDEKTIFKWGYTYGTVDALKEMEVR